MTVDASFRCASCSFEWKGERAACPRCRTPYAQESLFLVETAALDVEKINEETADPSKEWVGLPEFVPAEEPFKLVVSCDTEADRERLLETLGIKTIHKGTRGTLSVWWPDRPKEDLSSLRFEADDVEEEEWDDEWEAA